MTEAEQPDTPPLTRKRMRDIRNTGSTPVVAPADTQDPPADAIPAPSAPAEAPPMPPAPVAPLPRAAVPAIVPEPPVADMAVDLGVSPLTRRQARQQERIRTASVPVITPDLIAAHTAATASPELIVVPAPVESAPTSNATGPDSEWAPFAGAAQATAADTGSTTDTAPTRVDAAAQAEPDVATVEPDADDTATAQPDADDTATAQPDGDDTSTSALRGLFSDSEPDADPYAEVEVVVVDEPSFEAVDLAEDEDDDAAAALFAERAATDPDTQPESAERPVVSPLFGAALFADESAQPDLPPSFDDLLARGSTGSVGTSSALILSPPTGDSPIVGPVTATGEVLITGSFNLPEGLGSLGHAPGERDGREADAVLVDGELPAHSSPTPIAASAAISTVKSNGDVIKPPAPEKGSRLMMWLAITAGVLALALVGVLILAFVNGVF